MNASVGQRLKCCGWKANKHVDVPRIGSFAAGWGGEAADPTVALGGGGQDWGSSLPAGPAPGR